MWAFDPGKKHLNRQDAKIAKFYGKTQKTRNKFCRSPFFYILAFFLASSAPWRFQLPFFG
jgi:hypothetical protein